MRFYGHLRSVNAYQDGRSGQRGVAYETPYPSTSCARSTHSLYILPSGLAAGAFSHPPSLQHNADSGMYKLMADVMDIGQDRIRRPITIDLTPHPVHILDAQHINTYSGQLHDGLEP